MAVLTWNAVRDMKTKFEAKRYARASLWIGQTTNQELFQLRRCPIIRSESLLSFSTSEKGGGEAINSNLLCNHMLIALCLPLTTPTIVHEPTGFTRNPFI